MITTTLNANDFSGHRERGFPTNFDQTDNEDLPMSSHQRATLIELIYQKITDEVERESFLNSMSSMSRSDAEELRYSLLTGIWK